MVWYVRCSLVRLVVCEAFTCSTCGLVCVRCSLVLPSVVVRVRCSLVHLVVWCV